MKLLHLTAACFFFSLLILSGCAKYETLPSGTVVLVSTPVVSREQLTVPPPPPGEISGEIEYRIGLGDVLSVSSPQISQTSQTKEDGTSTLPGYRVYSSGKVFLPLVGGVQVSGLTIDEIQEKLQQEFKKFIKNPSINVEVVEFRSQPVYFLGNLATPGVQYLDRPVTLIQGFALAGGINPDADLRGARLVRENRIVPVDIYQLMYNNDLRHNIQLRPNDTVYIPGSDQQSVFLFGAVEKQGQVPLQNGRLSLLQALTVAGLGPQSLHNQENVRIIRSNTPTSGELIVVDVSRMITGQVLDMPLQNGDIIYMPRSGIANWNQAVSDMLPSLQAIGAILQPFVQINYLKDN